MQEKIKNIIDKFLCESNFDNDDSYNYEIDKHLSIKFSGYGCNPYENISSFITITLSQDFKNDKKKYSKNVLINPKDRSKLKAILEDSINEMVTHLRDDMSEKIKDIVDRFMKDRLDPESIYKYWINHFYYVKFQPASINNSYRVYLGCQLPGYESVKSLVYQFQNGLLNDDNEGLSAVIMMLYRETEKMNNDNLEISYSCYKSVIADNDILRDEIEHLKKESQAWKDKYFKEKMDHTTTKSRIIYAKHILNGNRDKDVVEHTEF